MQIVLEFNLTKVLLSIGVLFNMFGLLNYLLGKYHYGLDDMRRKGAIMFAIGIILMVVAVIYHDYFLL